MLLSFSMQVLIVGIEQFVTRVLPDQYQAWGVVLISRGISGLGLFVAIYMLFYSLTPSKYRRLKHCPKWPGALFTTLWRSEEHTSELQSLMRISYAVFCLKKKTPQKR